MTILNLVTRYDLTLFIMFGAYNPHPHQFIKKFRHVIKDDLIGHIRVNVPWHKLQYDAACSCFILLLEYELETIARDQQEIDNYMERKSKIMERS